MGEKKTTDDFTVDWENESKRYRKLYAELVQSSQNVEEQLHDEIFQKDEKICGLNKEIRKLRNIIYELSDLLNGN